MPPLMKLCGSSKAMDRGSKTGRPAVFLSLHEDLLRGGESSGWMKWRCSVVVTIVGPVFERAGNGETTDWYKAWREEKGPREGK